MCQKISKNPRPEINFTGNLFLRHFPFSEINICENDLFDFTRFFDLDPDFFLKNLPKRGTPENIVQPLFMS